MNVQSREVWATAQLEGWHRWPAAPDHRDYLAVRHRHLFHVAVTVPVGHDHRDVEFHDLRDTVLSCWQPEWGARSCEAIAQHVAGAVYDDHRVATCTVTVAEDGECGATIVTTREVPE